MRSNIFFEITNPCQESWEKMSVCGDGKFCGKCKKSVIDFSKKSSREVINHLESNKNVCGRLFKWQLESNILRRAAIYLMGILFFIAGCKQQKHLMGDLNMMVPPKKKTMEGVVKHKTSIKKIEA